MQNAVYSFNVMYMLCVMLKININIRYKLGEKLDIPNVKTNVPSCTSLFNNDYTMHDR